jgi:hypothetical protein
MGCNFSSAMIFRSSWLTSWAPSSNPLLVRTETSYPSLADQGICGYSTISPNTSYEGQYFGGFQGEFILPATSPANTPESLAALITKMIDTITALWPGSFDYANSSATWPTFYDW